MKKLCFVLLLLISLAICFSNSFSFCYAAVDGGTDSVSEPSYKVPIIMYHSTWKGNPNKYSVTPTTLENDLKYLKQAGYTTITVADLIAFQEKGMSLPQKAIMLTFDDGYTNNYIYAYPLFKKYKMKAVFSVIGKYIDDNYDANGVLHDKRAHATYEMIKEMHNSGSVEFQNHTYDMHKCGMRNAILRRRRETSEEYEKFLTEDLMRLHNNIKSKTGINMDAVTFPFGKYSEETISIIKKLGYKACITCTTGINHLTRSSDLFRLKRYNRPSGSSSENYFKKLGVI